MNKAHFPGEHIATCILAILREHFEIGSLDLSIHAPNLFKILHISTYGHSYV